MPIPTNARDSQPFLETTHLIMVNIHTERCLLFHESGLDYSNVTTIFFLSFIKVALKQDIMGIMMRIMVPLLHTAWGLVWVGVVAGANAMALDMDHHLLSMVHMLTHQSLWFMALSHLKSTLTKSLISSACMEMWRG